MSEKSVKEEMKGTANADCTQNVEEKRKQLFYKKWEFCGIRGKVKWRDKYYEKKQQMKQVGLLICESMTLRSKF